jgi:hypothetical protein
VEGSCGDCKEMKGIYWLDEELLASEEKLCYMELHGYSHMPDNTYLDHKRNKHGNYTRSRLIVSSTGHTETQFKYILNSKRVITRYTE